MNKKALLISLSTKLILGVLIIGIIALMFVFSAKLRFTIIGVGLFIAGLIFGLEYLKSNRSVNNKFIAFIVIFLTLGSLFIIIPYTGFVQQQSLSGSLPTLPLDGKVVVPVTGSIKCDYTNNEAPHVEVNSLSKDENCGVLCTHKYYEYNIQCLDAGDKGCRYKIFSYTCSGSRNKIRINSGSWQDASSYINIVKTLSSYDNIKVDLACLDGWGIIQRPASTPIVEVWQFEKKLYMNSEGYGWDGWMDGTAGCQLYSGSSYFVDRVIDVQDNSNPQIFEGETIAFGVSKQITVGWREDPVAGNVISYNNKNAICKSNQGIWEVIPLSTDINNYYKLGDLIVSKVQDNTVCCGNNECATSAGYVCDKNHCKKSTTATCTSGSCNPIQINTKFNQECREENGKFYLVSQTCSSDLCIKKVKTEVKCCPSFCDRQYGTGYFCLYDKGCETVNILQDCGNGLCCVEGSNFKVQNCAEGKECCMNLNSDFKGTCQETCTDNPAPECVKDEDCGTGEYCNKNSLCKPLVEQKCLWYQERYSTTKQQCKILGMFWCEDKPYEGCKTSGLIYTLAILILLGVMIVVVVVLLKDKQKRKYRRRK